MDHARVIYDLVELTPDTATIDVVMTVGGLVVLWVLGGVTIRLTYRARQEWRTRTARVVFVWSTVFISVFLVSYTGGTVWHLTRQPAREKYQAWLKGKDCRTSRGKVEQLIVNEKVWGSDPVPTFCVAQETFEYGTYSPNPRLEIKARGGVLKEGMPVEMMHRGGLILRITSLDETDHGKPEAPPAHEEGRIAR